MSEAPLAIDLFCGVGGWTEGLLAEGYRVVGFDLERHCYGPHRYPAQLVLQDVRTLHGSQFKDAALIVASPPCQAYSYRAMPWSRAKALPPPDNELFEACFRIQREAIAAAGHFIPLVVENVRGAQKWVGRARWHFGSFYLWGDVPALMPMTRARETRKRPKEGTGNQFCAVRPDQIEGQKNPGFRFDGSGRSFQTASVQHGVKVGGLDFSQYGTPGYKAQAFNTTAEQRMREDLKGEGVKHCGSGPIWFDTGPAVHSSRSRSRKAASALIAKIPFVLAQHIARSWKPDEAVVPMRGRR